MHRTSFIPTMQTMHPNIVPNIVQHRSNIVHPENQFFQIRSPFVQEFEICGYLRWERHASTRECPVPLGILMRVYSTEQNLVFTLLLSEILKNAVILVGYDTQARARVQFHSQYQCGGIPPARFLFWMNDVQNDVRTSFCIVHRDDVREHRASLLTKTTAYHGTGWCSRLSSSVRRCRHLARS